MKIAYTSYLGRGNLGDDLCFEVFKSLAEKFGATVSLAMPADPGKDQMAIMESQIANTDRLVIGGGSLFTYDYYLAMAVKANEMGKPVYFWGTGLDGMSLKTAVELADKEAIQTMELGAINLELLKSAVHGASKVLVRGPVTRDALEIIDPAFAKAKVIGDPGLMIDPENSTDLSFSIFDSGKPVMAVNWGAIDDEASGFGGDGAASAERFYNALEKISDQYSFLFFPMIDRDNLIHIDWAKKLGVKTAVDVLEEVVSAPDLCGVLAKCDMAIARKLHAQVLAASALIPFISMAYRSKCYDFAASINCVDIVVQTGADTLTDDILGLVESLKSGGVEKVSEIANYKNMYKNQIKDGLISIVK
jgi:polysaccharide pyruvyl transferase WcaK-like protein